MNKGDEHIRLGDNAHRGNRLVAVRHQRVIEQHGRHAHQRGVCARRQADGQHAAADPLACAQRGRVDGQQRAFARKVIEVIHAAEHIAQHGRNRRTRGVHAKGQDKDRVEHNVDHRADHAADHGSLGRALAAHGVAKGVGKQDKRRAERNVKQIVLGELPGVFGRAEQGEQRVHKHDDQPAEHHAEGERSIAAERGRGARLILLVLAEQNGDHRAAADPQQVGDRHIHDKHRIGQRNGRNLKRVVRLADEKRVRHVVHHEHKRRDHGRNRHLQHRSFDWRFFKYLFVLVHKTTLSQNVCWQTI